LKERKSAKIQPIFKFEERKKFIIEKKKLKIARKRTTKLTKSIKDLSEVL
jgi:hypothetical protein